MLKDTLNKFCLGFGIIVLNSGKFERVIMLSPLLYLDLIKKGWRKKHAKISSGAVQTHTINGNLKI